MQERCETLRGVAKHCNQHCEALREALRSIERLNLIGCGERGVVAREVVARGVRKFTQSAA